MTWVKIDDQFTDHPKIVQAGPLASWLYVCGLTYSSRYLTDGFIPSAQVRRLADVEDVTPLVTSLLNGGLWEEVEGGYRIHDYLEYNPSAEKVKAERAENARRQAEFRARKEGTASNTVSNDTTPSFNNGKRNTVTNSAPSPSPSRSNSLKAVTRDTGAPDEPDARITPRESKHALPEEWRPDEASLLWLREKWPHVDEARETEKFVRHFSAINPVKRTDRGHTAAWRNWMDRAERDYRQPARASPTQPVNRIQQMQEAIKQRREEREREKAERRHQDGDNGRQWAALPFGNGR